MPVNASSLYARNLLTFLETMLDKKDKVLKINWDDELIKGTLVAKDGKVMHASLPSATGSVAVLQLPRSPLTAPAVQRLPRLLPRNPTPKSRCLMRALSRPALCHSWRYYTFAGFAHASGGADVSPAVYQLMVFVIAIFVGYFVVWGVTPALHTPLMA